MDYFGKSQKAAEETKIATAREKIQLRVAEITTDKISKENRNLKVEELIEIENEEITVEKNQDGTIYTEVDEENEEYAIAECDGYKFKVYASGKVELYTNKELVQITYEKTSVSADKTKITILITVTGNKGLEKLIKPDNLEVYPTEDRNKISLDFTADSGVDYTFKAIGKGGTEETKVINVTAGDIYTIEDLEDVKVELGLSYRLMKSLDFKDINSYKTVEKYDYYNQDADGDGKQDNSWEPIGNSTTNFTGTFDGQFYTINNLYINTTTDYIGLFGVINGTIKNLKLENIDITTTGNYVGGIAGNMYGSSKVEKVGVSGKIQANDYIGGISGNARGEISKVYSECDIKGTGNVGGIVGDGNTSISDSYTLGKLEGSCVGGLIGDGWGHWPITNSYSICNIICSDSRYQDPLVGWDYQTVSGDSYWTTETSGLASSSINGTRKRIYELLKQETFENWDFENVWEIEEGNTTPYLKWAGKRDAVKKDNIRIAEGFESSGTPMEGKGTEADPYKITTVEQLEDVRLFLEANYVLENDLDLSQKYGEEKSSWTPLGDSTASFTGTFDGKYHTINNLYINTTTNYIGLFGVINGTIKNLKLENIDVTSTGSYVGGIAGNMGGSSKVEKVGVSGKIQANDYIGGISGNARGEISKVYSECDIKGTGNVGGIVGDGNTSISDSYTLGKLEGSCVGGLIGDGWGHWPITNSYSICNIICSDSRYQDPLVGWDYQTVSGDSYWTTETSGLASSRNGTKVELSNMFNQSTFENWDFENIWGIEEGSTTPYFKWAGKRDTVKRENISVIQ